MHFGQMYSNTYYTIHITYSDCVNKSNKTPTWCNTVQVLFLQSLHVSGVKRPSSGVFKTCTAATGTCVIVAGRSSHHHIRAETCRVTAEIQPAQCWIKLVFYLTCIIEAVELITRHMLINTWKELQYRLDICRATRAAHIEVYGRA